MDVTKVAGRVFQTACAKTWNGLWTMDCGLWTVDCGLWAMDCGLCSSFIINGGK